MMENETKKVAFHTLGCKLNYAETSTIARQFETAGYTRVDFHAKADLYVINTCSVTENADKEFRKIVNRAKRLAPDSKIAVIGCYAQLRPDAIVNSAAVDVVLGMKEKFNLINHVQFDENETHPRIIHDSAVHELYGCTPAYSVGDRVRSFLKIQDGCDYPCTYCTIPMARGMSRSLDPQLLVRQAREIAAKGVKEIVLTGVNVGDYRHGDSIVLLDLLKLLDQTDGIERIRISSIEPNLLTDEIIEYVADSSSILPHFHIPLQAGSNKVLSLMKRRYTVDTFVDRIHKVRELIPHAGIGVDVIVGFPGEGEQEFEETRSLLGDLDVSYLHVFTYSERPNTPAITYPNKVAVPERKRRNRVLTDLSASKNQTFALSHVNQHATVLFESEQNGLLSGMTENYLKVFVASQPQALINQVAEVEITGFKDRRLMGKIVEQ